LTNKQKKKRSAEDGLKDFHNWFPKNQLEGLRISSFKYRAVKK